MTIYSSRVLRDFEKGFMLDGWGPHPVLHGPFRGPDNQVYYYDPYTDSLVDPKLEFLSKIPETV
jgi:hypothetical protein